MDLVTQLIGALGMSLIISSFQFKHRRTIIMLQTAGSACFALHFGLLEAITAVVMNVVAVARNILFARYHGADRPMWPFAIVMAAIIILPILTWNGWISLLPMMALLFGTIGLWHRNEQTIRLWTLGAPPFWIVHNVITGSIPGVINECIALCSIIVGWVRYRTQREGTPVVKVQ